MNDKFYDIIQILAAAGLGVLILTKVVPELTNPGIRNNNPLNIDYNPANKWVGQTGRNGRFATFDTIESGFRAANGLLNTYAKKYNLKSIHGIISKWAPDNENDTKNYIDFVAKFTGFFTFTSIETKKDRAKLLQAMAKMETGKLYDLELIQKSIA